MMENISMYETSETWYWKESSTSSFLWCQQDGLSTCYIIKSTNSDTYCDNNLCTTLANAKQPGNDQNYLYEIDDDASPHKAKEIKHLPFHNSYL